MKNYYPHIRLAIAILLLFVATRIIFSCQSIPNQLNHNGYEALSSDLSATMGRIDGAIKLDVKNTPVKFAENYESPFKNYIAQEPHEHQSNATNATASAVSLFLKGILKKSNPLAILEDGHGQTYIRGAGDTVAGQVVVKIKENSVILKGGQGKPYELTVKEE